MPDWRAKGGMNPEQYAVTDANGRPKRSFMTAGQVLVIGRHHGLALAKGSVLAHLEYAGGWLLR